MIPLWLSRMPFSCSEKYASHPCTVSRVTGSSLFSVGHSYACLSTAGDQGFGPYFLVGWSFTVDPSESRRLRINRRRLKRINERLTHINTSATAWLVSQGLPQDVALFFAVKVDKRDLASLLSLPQEPPRRMPKIRFTQVDDRRDALEFLDGVNAGEGRRRRGERIVIDHPPSQASESLKWPIVSWSLARR